jgi:hypothetical protein
MSAMPMPTLRPTSAVITRAAADYGVHVRPLAFIAIAMLAALTLASTGMAAGGKKRKPQLWATVNVCDTTDHPNTVGIRASMPGTGDRRDRMFMRFDVEFFRDSDRAWHDLDSASAFTYVGSGRFRRRESGRNVMLKPPPPGAVYRVRGVVTFEWRRGAKVLRRAVRFTKAGHKGTTGSDPKGFSAADCRVLP